MDLLGWAGCLKVAEGSVVLEAFLSGRRTHKNIAMGIQTANKLLHLDSVNPGIFILYYQIFMLKQGDGIL